MSQPNTLVPQRVRTSPPRASRRPTRYPHLMPVSIGISPLLPGQTQTSEKGPSPVSRKASNNELERLRKEMEQLSLELKVVSTKYNAARLEYERIRLSLEPTHKPLSHHIAQNKTGKVCRPC